MGCDIHLVLEKRKNGKWVGVDTFQSHPLDWSSPVARSRNYERFAKLANVRGSGPLPRGLPPDASDTTILLTDECGSDGHSHSWLPLAEASEIWSQTQQGLSGYGSKYPDSYFFGVDTSPGSRDKRDDYRVVFWFDN
jgi:hypothetical protein